MPITNKDSKRVANALSRTPKDDPRVALLLAERKSINESRANATAVAQPVKRRKNATGRPFPMVSSSSSASLASSVEASVSQKKRQELISAVTESTTETKADGSKVEKKVTRTLTAVEEFTVTMTTKVENVIKEAKEGYSRSQKALYGTSPGIERAKNAKAKLQAIPSPYDKTKTVLQSIETLTVDQLLDYELKFLETAMDDDAEVYEDEKVPDTEFRSIIIRLPPTSALRELVSNISSDAKTYLPISTFEANLAASSSTQAKVAPILREHRVDFKATRPKVEGEDAYYAACVAIPGVYNKNPEGHGHTKALLEAQYNQFYFGEYFPLADKVSRTVAIEATRVALELPADWSPVDADTITAAAMARMERVIPIFDAISGCLLFKDEFFRDATPGDPEDDQAWVRLKRELARHFVTMKILVGANVPLNLRNAEVDVVDRTWNNVVGNSFFGLDTAFMEAKYRDSGVCMATIKLDSGLDFEVEMPLLHMGWKDAFNAVADDQERKFNDLDWGMVTPQNLILHGQARSPGLSQILDKMRIKPTDGLTLELAVDTAYSSADYNEKRKIEKEYPMYDRRTFVPPQRPLTWQELGKL
jgi:hypothetical protein